MTHPHITHLQQQASNPTAHVFVNASAGSGKTKVLVDRCLRLFLQGVPLESLLCITFTTAAATEMQERLLSQSKHFLMLSLEELEEALKTLGCPVTPETLALARSLYEKLLSQGHRLRIQTLHSFCQSLLSQFPLESGLAPDISLADEGQQQDLLLEAFERLLLTPETKDQLNPVFKVLSPEAFLQFAGTLKFEERQKLMDFAASSTPPAIDLPPLDKDLVQKFTQSLGEGSEADQGKAQILQETASDRQGGEPSSAYLDLFLKKDGTPRQRLCTKSVYQACPDLEDFQEAETDALLRWRESRLLKEAQDLQNHFCSLLQFFFTHYTELKQQARVMDYEDLIGEGLNLLTQSEIMPWISYKLGSQIQHILVDEAQDMSPLQWRIVQILWQPFFETSREAMSSPQTAFVVGDKKQSIYGFQGAKPHLFMETAQNLEQEAKAQQAPFESVDLDLSFRCAPAVLQAVDQAFQDPTLGVGLASPHLHHRPFHENREGSFQLHPLIPQDPELPEEEIPEAQALDFARFVQKTLASHWIFSENRAAQPEDVMILFRARDPWMPRVKQALKSIGLPVKEEDRQWLQKNPLVQWIMALGRSLTRPPLSQDLYFLCRETPLLNLSLPQVKALLSAKPPLSRTFQDTPWKPFFAEVTQVARKERPTTFFMKVWEGLKVLGVAPAFLEKYRAGFYLLLGLAETAPPEAALSLSQLLWWIDQQSQAQKALASRTEAAITCTTIHGAKGLQAPIVILADTTRGPQPLKGAFWPEGEGAPWILPTKDQRPESLAAWVQKARNEEIAESHRLLYVAMTRAVDHLIITGFSGARAPAAESWYPKLMKALGEPEDLPLQMGQAEGNVRPLQTSMHLPESQGTPLAWVSNPLALKETASVPWHRAHLPESGEAKDSTGVAKLRGQLTHLLLQDYPHAGEQNFTSICAGFEKELGSEMIHTTRSMVEKFLADPQHQWLWEEGQSEVPLCGVIAGKRYLARIDRLIVKPDEVIGIEFKTGTPSPTQWQDQVKVYGALLKQIYDKPVRVELIHVEE